MCREPATPRWNPAVSHRRTPGSCSSSNRLIACRQCHAYEVTFMSINPLNVQVALAFMCGHCLGKYAQLKTLNQ